MLMVQCTVIGRAKLLRCDNLDDWSTRETYLVADICEYTDDDESSMVDEQLQEMVEDALYQLIDALLECDRDDSRCISADCAE